MGRSSVKLFNIVENSFKMGLLHCKVSLLGLFVLRRANGSPLRCGVGMQFRWTPLRKVKPTNNEE